MANYESTLISNYFETKNNEKVLEVLLNLGFEETYIDKKQNKISIASYEATIDDSMYVVFNKQDEVVATYNDWTYEELNPEILNALEDENDNTYSVLNIYEYLQSMLVENETIQVKEVGNEKLRYNSACGLVITKKDYKWFNLDSIMEEYAEKNK